MRHLGILAVFGGLLAVLWFAAPRWVWPDSYVPKPSLRALDSNALSMNRMAQGAPGNPRGAGLSRSGTQSEATVVVPARSASRLAAHSRRQPPRPADGQAVRHDDDTISIQQEKI